MAYDEELAARAKEIIEEVAEPREQKMFGGIAFMVKDHMCVGVMKEDLIIRLGGDGADAAVKKPHIRRMEMGGRQMKGFLLVSPDGTEKEKDLRGWIKKAYDFVSTLPPKKAKKK